MIARAGYITIVASPVLIYALAAISGEGTNLQVLASIAVATAFGLAFVSFVLRIAPRVRRKLGLDPHPEWYSLRSHAPPPQPRPQHTPGVPRLLVIATVGSLTTSLITIVALSLAYGDPLLITLWLGFALPVVVAAPFVVRRLNRAP